MKGNAKICESGADLIRGKSKLETCPMAIKIRMQMVKITQYVNQGYFVITKSTISS